MTIRQQVSYWGGVLVVFVALLWLLSDALLPFVLGAAIAYLTDPLADWLETHGLSRVLATVVITVCSVGAVVVALVLVIPLLIGQVRDLVTLAPAYIEQARQIAITWIPEIENEDAIIGHALANLRENAEAWSVGILRRVWSGGIALANFLAVLLVTPVVAFYLLMDWDRMVGAIDDYLPRQHRATIHQVVRDLDRVLAGFVRGQMTVCLILGTFYAICLVGIGLSFGLLIGVFAGLISFIPFVGSIVGGALSMGVAVAQFWDDPLWIAVVALIFVAGQAIEGNFLTPKLVGDKVGLHPVWLMFALSAFGVVFGFVGLLVAVPAAAAIGVIGRFLLEQYRASGLYQSPAPPSDVPPPPGDVAVPTTERE